MLPGLYVHVPFCGSKCPYCGFYSIPSQTPIAGWLEGLEKEVFHTRSRLNGLTPFIWEAERLPF